MEMHANDLGVTFSAESILLCVSTFAENENDKIIIYSYFTEKSFSRNCH